MEPVLILFKKKIGLMANQTENNHLFSTKIARPGYLAMHLSFLAFSMFFFNYKYHILQSIWNLKSLPIIFFML